MTDVQMSQIFTCISTASARHVEAVNAGVSSLLQTGMLIAGFVAALIVATSWKG